MKSAEVPCPFKGCLKKCTLDDALEHHIEESHPHLLTRPFTSEKLRDLLNPSWKPMRPLPLCEELSPSNSPTRAKILRGDKAIQRRMAKYKPQEEVTYDFADLLSVAGPCGNSRFFVRRTHFRWEEVEDLQFQHLERPHPPYLTQDVARPMPIRAEPSGTDSTETPLKPSIGFEAFKLAVSSRKQQQLKLTSASTARFPSSGRPPNGT
jgi:hypothetical protein